MIRKSVKTLLLMFVAAVFALGSMAEAAPGKNTKPRVSARSSVAKTSATKKKKAKRVKKAATQKTRPAAKATTKPR